MLIPFLPFEYEELHALDSCNFIAKKNGRVGMIDRKGNTILPFRYERFFLVFPDFVDDHVLLFRDGKWRYVHRDGTEFQHATFEIIPPRFTLVRHNAPDNVIVAVQKIKGEDCWGALEIV